MKLRSNYRVQVSRMVLTPLNVACGSGGTGNISPRWCSAQLFSLTCNSKHRNLYAHFIVTGANSSLLPPRHRCYALLSSALSRLVWETRRNSYQPWQDGLW
jgi:hypothetical protein